VNAPDTAAASIHHVVTTDRWSDDVFLDALRASADTEADAAVAALDGRLADVTEPEPSR
jgi:hypothetical protein